MSFIDEDNYDYDDKFIDLCKESVFIYYFYYFSF